jgi:hypothetical protein
MPPLTDNGNRPTACILSESAGRRSRENITLLEGNGVIAPNTVLAASGSGYVPAAAAGTAVAIALYGGDTTDGDIHVAALTRDAEVNGHTLVYAPDVDTPAEVTTKNTQLAAVGIIVR